MYVINPDIEKVTKGVEKIKEALSKALIKTWNLIEADILENLMINMSKQIKAVVASKSWYTKYEA